MHTYIILLRGINVSGQKKIKMADLRALLSIEQSLNDVQTYIQSGNIVLRSSLAKKAVGVRVHKLIKSQYGFDVPTTVFASEEWQKIASNNPYLKEDSEMDIRRLYITLMSEDPRKENLEKLLARDFGEDRIVPLGRTLYLCYETRVSDSKLDNNLIERTLNLSCTSRNWRTTLKLSDLSHAASQS